MSFLILILKTPLHIVNLQAYRPTDYHIVGYTHQLTFGEGNNLGTNKLSRMMRGTERN